MNELVERIAKAIFQADPWTQHSYESHHAFYVEMARAALREVVENGAVGQQAFWRGYYSDRIAELERQVQNLTEERNVNNRCWHEAEDLVQELERQVTQAELETQRWVTAWGEVKRETERLRMERMDHPLARISDWLGKRVTDLEAGLRQAADDLDSGCFTSWTLAARLRALLVEKK